MAIGDDAAAQGWQLVPESGEDGKVKYGAREINRTRDYAAQVKELVPTSVSAFQTATGIYYGTADPPALPNGSIYFRYI